MRGPEANRFEGPPGQRRWDLLVAIGASWGGLAALRALLGALPATFRHPVAVVLHRTRAGGSGLVEVLSQWTPLKVVEPDDGDWIEAAHVYVAPAGYHMLVSRHRFALAIDEPDTYSRPSIDALFHSVGDTVGPRSLGILLTGANQDGARGLAHMKQAGGRTAVQDPDEAERGEMPRAGLETGLVDRRLKIEEMAAWISHVNLDLDPGPIRRRLIE